MSKLENSSLVIEVNEHGAELSKIFSRKYNKDFLWSGDSKYWGRKAPVLFPIVGRLRDNETIIDDKTYYMSQHGFARDCDFKLIKEDKNRVTYSLISNEETKKKYPYTFELQISYTLIENSLEVLWNVKNTGTETMYFSIGAHPAFNIPFNNDENMENYYLSFKTKQHVEKYVFQPPYIKERTEVEALSRIDIKPELFSNDAIVYSGVDEVSIKSKDSDMSLKVSFKDFPFVGIWSPFYKETNTMAPFVCIEPWYGIADFVDSAKIFKEKFGINKLEPYQEFKADFKITVI